MKGAPDYPTDGGSMAPDDGLDHWIRDLRGRLDRGDLAGIRPIDVGHGTAGLDGEVVIRILVADLDDLDDAEGSWRVDGRWAERRRDLLDHFRRLRSMIG